MALLELMMVIWSFIPTPEHPNILALGTPFVPPAPYVSDSSQSKLSPLGNGASNVEDADTKWAKSHGIDPAALKNWETLDDYLDFIDDEDFTYRDKLIDLARIALHGENATGDILYSTGGGSRGDGETEEGPSAPPTFWPGGRVPYVIDSSVSVLETKIQRAIEQYHQKTCIRFVPRTNERDYLLLQRGIGCNSNVGMEGGSQITNLGSACGYLGTIIHELAHVLGLEHEHQRPDRDEYITIYYENIQKGAESQFEKMDPSEMKIVTKFSYESIMIYGNYAFSVEPGKRKTMAAKNGTPLKDPYEKSELDQATVNTINTFYQC